MRMAFLFLAHCCTYSLLSSRVPRSGHCNRAAASLKISGEDDKIFPFQELLSQAKTPSCLHQVIDLRLALSPILFRLPAFMRSATSFLLSLLMFAAIASVQMAVMWSSEAQATTAVASSVNAAGHEFGVDVLQEFEEDVQDDEVEFSIHRPHRSVAASTAQDDRNELFGPPEAVAMGVAHVWVPPSAHMAHPTSHWPDNMLRPPSFSLLQAGMFQRA